MADFWKDEYACWKLMDCPEYVYKKCPTYFNPERPCWEVAYTQCEILIGIHKDCEYCKVYRLNNKVIDQPMPRV